MLYIDSKKHLVPCIYDKQFAFWLIFHSFPLSLMLAIECKAELFLYSCSLKLRNLGDVCERFGNSKIDSIFIFITIFVRGLHKTYRWDYIVFSFDFSSMAQCKKSSFWYGWKWNFKLYYLVGVMAIQNYIIWIHFLYQ